MRSLDPPSIPDEKTVRKLEKRIEEAVIEAVGDM